MSKLVNLVELKFDPADLDRALQALLHNAKNAVNEPGCHQFDVTASKDDASRLVLYEVYDDEAALADHREQQHFKDFFAIMDELGDKVERNARLFEIVS